MQISSEPGWHCAVLTSELLVGQHRSVSGLSWASWRNRSGSHGGLWDSILSLVSASTVLSVSVICRLKIRGEESWIYVSSCQSARDLDNGTQRCRPQHPNPACGPLAAHSETGNPFLYSFLLSGFIQNGDSLHVWKRRATDLKERYLL